MNMKIIKRFVAYVRSVKVLKVAIFTIVPIFLMAVIVLAANDVEINACVNNKTGSVRIINFLGRQCTKSETSLVWNKQGVQGIQGVQGETGLKGDKGDIGLSNPQIIGGGGDFRCNNCTLYFPAFTSSSGANESDVSQNLPVAGTLSQFSVHIKHNSTPNLIFTVMKNGVATLLSCSIDTSKIDPISCNNNLDSVVFNVNDTISIRTAGSGIIETMRWTAKYQ